MQFQVTIFTDSGGAILCGVSGDSLSDAERKLAYLPGAGRLRIASIIPIPPRSER